MEDESIVELCLARLQQHFGGSLQRQVGRVNGDEEILFFVPIVSCSEVVSPEHNMSNYPVCGGVQPGKYSDEQLQPSSPHTTAPNLEAGRAEKLNMSIAPLSAVTESSASHKLATCNDQLSSFGWAVQQRHCFFYHCNIHLLSLVTSTGLRGQ